MEMQAPMNMPPGIIGTNHDNTAPMASSMMMNVSQ
jgi:hypothetical protein